MPTFRVFSHCLLKANWCEKTHRGKVIKRGCFITGREQIAKETGLSIQQVRRALNNLKTTNDLTITSSRQGTEIKVNNYDKYQPSTIDATNKQPAKEPQKNRKRTTTNKTNKLINKLFDQFWASYPRKVSKGYALKAWEKIKPDENLTNQIIASIEARKLVDPEFAAGGQYVKHPATWLNATGWEDDITRSFEDQKQSSSTEFGGSFLDADDIAEAQRIASRVGYQ